MSLTLLGTTAGFAQVLFSVPAAKVEVGPNCFELIRLRSSEERHDSNATLHFSVAAGTPMTPTRRASIRIHARRLQRAAVLWKLLFMFFLFEIPALISLTTSRHRIKAITIPLK